ncbi:hypothetical protein ACTMTI_06190 [Nonomuraea sp. H19]|uniref:hypothetical protein n=1 Tax=Nonomuraea sp. H19 TaxID=3452206 RepID=UPI003F88F3C7
MNDIERGWRAAKYEDYPQRAQTDVDAIGEAVDRAMTRQRGRIRGSGRMDHLHARLLARG